MEMIMDVDGGLVAPAAAAACTKIPKLKRKRSSEQLMLRKTTKPKVFLQDLQYSSADEWSPNVRDVNMNISDELSKMLSTQCLIEKGRWMAPRHCMIGNTSYQFALIGYNYDRSDGCFIEGALTSDQPMCGNVNTNEIAGRQTVEVDKSNTIEMKQSNDDDAQMMCGFDDVQSGSALTKSKWVENLFDGSNVQRSFLKGDLHANASFSYRTHYFLNN